MALFNENKQDDLRGNGFFCEVAVDLDSKRHEGHFYCVFWCGFIYGPNSMDSNTQPFSRKYTIQCH